MLRTRWAEYRFRWLNRGGIAPRGTAVSVRAQLRPERTPPGSLLTALG